MIIESVRHRGLRHLIEDHNPQFIRQDLTQRIIAVATALGQADNIAQFVATAPRGWRVHRLTGNRSNEWSVSVSGNWRITFQEENGSIYNLNLEDYH